MSPHRGTRRRWDGGAVESNAGRDGERAIGIAGNIDRENGEPRSWRGGHEVDKDARGVRGVGRHGEGRAGWGMQDVLDVGC